MTKTQAGPPPPAWEQFRPLGPAALTLMPLHLLIDRAGNIISAGATLRRIIGDRVRFQDSFEPVGLTSLADLAQAERVFLRLRDFPDQILRGRGMAVGAGATLYDLGFGVGVIDAIRRFDLTDRDFAPSELVMEVLFLHEANTALTAELTRANLRLEEARTKAEAEAFTDPLTGLFNRRGLELAFRMLREGALLDPPEHFTLAVLDLDRFKELNDTFGHAAGDEMLRAVAARLRAITRDEDTIARAGGDEFVLLLPHCSDHPQAAALGHRIVQSIERPVTINARECRISTSVGLALSRDFQALSWHEMEAAADQALYDAKRAGRGRVRAAQPA